MLIELDRLLDHPSTAHVEVFKIAFIRWTRQLVDTLSRGLAKDRWKSVIDLDKPLESLYYMAFEMDKPFSDIPQKVHPSVEITRLQEQVQTQQAEIQDLKNHQALWHQCQEKLQTAEKAVEKLNTCTLNLTALRAQYEALTHTQTFLQDHVLTLQNTHERNLFTMALMNASPGGASLPFEPSDRLQSLLNTFSTNRQLIQDCQPPPPSSCSRCAELIAQHGTEMAACRQQQEYNITTLAEVRQRLRALILENDRLKIHPTTVNKYQSNVFMTTHHQAYQATIDQLQARLYQVSEERNQLKYRSHDEGELERVKTQLRQLMARVQDTLLGSSGTAESRNRLSDMMDQISRTDPPSLDMELADLTYPSPADSELVLSVIKNLFHLSSLEEVTLQLQELESRWSLHWPACLALLKTYKIDDTTLDAFTALLKGIEGFTGGADMITQESFMKRLFETVTQFGGMDFLNTLYEYKHMVKNLAEVTFVLHHVLMIKNTDKHMTFQILFSFISDVMQSLGEMKEAWTVETIKKKYIISLYLPELKDHDATEDVSIDDLIQGYLRDKKRRKITC